LEKIKMYSKSHSSIPYIVVVLIALLVGCTIMYFAILEEQEIDDLRPRIEACYPITKNWCWPYKKFADSSDFEYYRQIYEEQK